jgi:hypothetical protein
MNPNDLFPPGEKCPMIMKGLAMEVAKTLGNTGYHWQAHFTKYWVSIAQGEWTRIMAEADRKQVFHKIVADIDPFDPRND